MTTKQKIDRVDFLRNRVSNDLEQRRIRGIDVSSIASDVEEISDIQDGLEECINSVFSTILRVLKLEQTKTMAIDTDVTEYMYATKKKVTIELMPRSSKPPKMLFYLLIFFDYSIPSEWMDFDEDKMEEAIRKFISRRGCDVASSMHPVLVKAGFIPA